MRAMREVKVFIVVGSVIWTDRFGRSELRAVIVWKSRVVFDMDVGS